MWDWDRLTNFFKSLTMDRHPYIVEHANLILNLIPLLRDNPNLANVQPGAAHAELFLAIPNQDKVVSVWGQGNGKYRISIGNPDLSSTDEISVSSEKAIGTIEKYLQKLQHL
ncbi:MAG TPA: hypothetical protein VHO69_11660 [Phototrophicaceae bacterium]|nr:hypothetical protein [Phototrophicaceae bacterium]